MDTFEKLLAELSRSKVEYVLIGGLAVDLCGFSRATDDVDILVEDSRGNIERLLECLGRFGEGSSAELGVDDFTSEEGCIRVVEDFPLDVFTVLDGKRHGDLLPETRNCYVEGEEVRYLGPRGLIALKSRSLRPRDQLDVQALTSILDEREKEE
jgi:predicted nucleotidyltransferase